MSALQALFIGGGGLISSACARAAVDRGIDLSILTRQGASSRPLPAQARMLKGDIRDPESADAAMSGKDFDVVVNFVAFDTGHVCSDIERFSGRVGQYIFISSASIYHKPVAQLPIVESTPRSNPAWSYSRAKIACEQALEAAYRDSGFPATIVRPSHTYDRRSLPFRGGWTVVERMRRGKPVVVHGDGTSLWVLTHHRDFARGFVALLGNPHAIGDSVHITSDELLTWDQIYLAVARAAGADALLVHRSTETIATALPEWGPPLLGDAAHSVIFDNTKIRRLAPGFVATIAFEQGAREIVEWHDADPSRRVVDPELDAVFDRLAERSG